MELKILKWLGNTQLQTAAYKPTTPYTGKLPTKTVKKGSKGTDVKAVQTFLNWCIKAGLKVDGSCGKNTTAKIRSFQKQYKIKVDGVFGSQSRAKAKAIINAYKPKPAPKPAPSQTWVDKANMWAKKTANEKYHYVVWKPKINATHTCPICQGRKYDNYYGWNCIGFASAIWHHGGGLKSICNCHTITNAEGEKMYNAKTDAEALAIAKKKFGLTNLIVIRNKNGIPKEQWKAGDICLQFKGSTYKHMFYYMGNGQIADSSRTSRVADNIKIRNYKNYSAKIIIRYTGE